MTRAPRLLCPVLWAVLCSSPLFADPRDEPALAEVPLDEQAATWLRALRSGDFEARAEATRRLIAEGSAAVPDVERCAESGDLETSSRCLEVLKRMRAGSDPAAKGAAEKSLERLAGCANRSVAQRAEAVLRKPDPVVARNRLMIRGGVVVRAPRFAPGFAPMRARPVAPVVPRKFQRAATVEDGGRKIELREVIGREISVKVTETVDGKPRVSEHTARNSAELRARHPDAYALYAKHLRGKRFEELADAPPAPAPAPVIRPVPLTFGVPAAGRNFRVRTLIVNGKREIEVDNDGTKVSIRDDSGKDITVRVTEKSGEKTTEKEYRAATLDELRRKHPEGAALYDKYGAATGNLIRWNGAGGIIQLRARGLERALPEAPLPPRALPLLPER